MPKPTFRTLALGTFAALTMQAEATITFSEFPVDTPISDQYADQGVLFSGDSPFITNDGANPTSPVLAGTPRFFGRLSSTFVSPGNKDKPAAVKSVTFDAGYFDSVGSVRIEWFDKDGNKLGQRANSTLGIERFEISDSGGIAKISIGIFADEPAGYGIDNFDLAPVGPSVVFREKKESKGEGFWFLLGDEVPGFDHCGLHLDNLVYESHPGYRAARYVNFDGSESVDLQEIFGVQAQHTLGTFLHDSTARRATRVRKVDEVPVDRTLAEDMKTFIDGRIQSGAEFRYLGDGSLSSLLVAMDPALQKGGPDNKFTCVGIVEAAAESAGHNGGEGFVPNAFEKLDVPLLGSVPLLSPELLYYAMRVSQAIDGLTQWFQGILDPVDFLVTDPVGRRMGFTKASGRINEIPGAFLSADGPFEQFFIPNPLPGQYRVDLVGKGKPAMVGIGDADGSHAEQFATLAKGEKAEQDMQVSAKTGTRGDVNGDGDVNTSDLTVLQSVGKLFVNPNDPRDLTGDGIVSKCDVLALERLLAPPAGNVPFAGVVTNLNGKFIARVAGRKPTKGRDSFSVCFSPTQWAATDALGNEVSGAWEAANRAGTLIRLSFDDTDAVFAQAAQVARAALGTGDPTVVLTNPPTLSVVRTSGGRYKASLKISFTATGDDGVVRRGSYVSKLTL